MCPLPSIDDRGRMAAFEVLHSNHAVRNLIREGKSHQLLSVMQMNRKAGMITMDESIQQLFMENRISLETAFQFAVEPETMKGRLF